MPTRTYRGWTLRWSPARALPWQAVRGTAVLYARTEPALTALIDVDETVHEAVAAAPLVKHQQRERHQPTAPEAEPTAPAQTPRLTLLTPNPNAPTKMAS